MLNKSLQLLSRCRLSHRVLFSSSSLDKVTDNLIDHLSAYVTYTNCNETSKILHNIRLNLKETLDKTTKIQCSTHGSARLAINDSVYANNYVNFENIDVIGFDLDYTLVTYTVELQRLIYNLARELLVSTYGFPIELRSISFDPNFAIRGLSVDKTNGTICKLSHLQRVSSKSAYIGKKQLTNEQLEEYYGEFRTVSTGDIASMKPLNDMFAMAEACLVADVMQVLRTKQDSYGELFDASAVVGDVLGAIREVHISGAMHTAILRDPHRFIVPSPDLHTMLLRYKNAGKKLFLCTNRFVLCVCVCVVVVCFDGYDMYSIRVQRGALCGGGYEVRPGRGHPRQR